MAASAAVQAQAAFPPADLRSAPSFDVAIKAAIGTVRPEPGTYISIDLPDVVEAGEVSGKVSMALPGTLYLIVLRGAPAAMKVGGEPLRPAQSAAPPVGTSDRPAGAPLSPYIEGKKFAPGQAATMPVIFEVQQTDWYTALAYSQGRWYMAVKEIKVGQSARAAAKSARPPQPRR